MRRRKGGQSVTKTLKRVVRYAAIGAGISLASPSVAQVAYTDWYGSGVITAVNNCPIGNFENHVNRVFHARFLPPNIGDNGAKVSLSFLSQHWAQGYARNSAFTSAFQNVTAQTIARFPGPSGYPVQVRVISQTPGSITAATPMITLRGQVKGFSGFPTNDNCVADFTVTVFRP
jgi:hypothetical protein